MGNGSHGNLIWSVNLRPVQAAHVDQVRRLRHGIAAVLHVFRQHQMPATWTLPDPAATPQYSHEILRHDGQEIGLLGDSRWVGAGRTVFARELARRTTAAEAAGMPIHCLATGGAPFDSDLDLLVRHRIGTVRADAPHRRANSSRRFGIWQIAASDVLPGRSGLWRGRFGYQRMLRHCARQQRTLLLVVDANRVAEDAPSLRLLQAVCRYASRHTGLRIAALAELAQRRMQSQDASPSSRSILRAA